MVVLERGIEPPTYALRVPNLHSTFPLIYNQLAMGFNVKKSFLAQFWHSELKRILE